MEKEIIDKIKLLNTENSNKILDKFNIENINFEEIIDKLYSLDMFLSDEDINKLYSELSPPIRQTIQYVDSITVKFGPEIYKDAKMFYSVIEKGKHEVKIPEDIFNKLAELTSEYSMHSNKKSIFVDTSRKIQMPNITEDVTHSDEIGKNKMALLEALDNYILSIGNRDDVLPLVALRQNLLSLPNDTCNQDNAVTFAKLLNKYIKRLGQLTHL